MVTLRRAAHRSAGPAVADLICERFSEARRQGLVIQPDDIVSGFWPIRDEIDIRTLLTSLHEEGLVCALPVVGAPRTPLTFRRWRVGDPLVPAQMGLSEPDAASPSVEPTVMLVPLLAADPAGNRLGYGGGYYDLTLQAARAQRPVTAIGIAFDAQIVQAVPYDESDQPLDWIVTEKRVIPVGGRAQR